ncbi:uncharacterized protein [Diadema antillarum]|uniref:uncharacterized protein n=1 Tax=Diadema antillarum TaxID=105358 RepID=UPI003A8753CB
MATLQAGGAPPWAHMPMPAGWEAKYDPNLGRYFYINHQTRSTQWTDPRQQMYQAQQASPRMQPSPRMPRAEQIPMQPIIKPKCKVCKSIDVPSSGQTCPSCKVAQQQREAAVARAREEMEEEKRRQEQQAKLEKERERRRVQSAKRREEQTQVRLSDSKKAHVYGKVKKAVPEATDEMLYQALDATNYDEAQSVEMLKMMVMGKTPPGARERFQIFLPAVVCLSTAVEPKEHVLQVFQSDVILWRLGMAGGSSPIRSATSSPARQLGVSFPETSFTTTVTTSETDLSQAGASSMSAANKAKVKSELCDMFSKTDPALVDMLLETCQYDKEKTKQLLLSMGETLAPKQKGQSKMSEAKKKQIRDKVKRAVPKASDAMVNLAVDTTSYNEQRAIEVLKMMIESDSMPSSSLAQAETSTSGRQIEVTFPETSFTSSVTTSVATKSIEVTFPSSGTTSTTTTSAAGTSASTVYSAGGSKMSTADKKKGGKKAPKAQKELDSPLKNLMQNAYGPKGPVIAKRTTRAQPEMKSPNKKSPRKQPRSGGVLVTPPSYSSSTGAVGPDPTLPKGASLDNLLDNYVAETGPNTELSQGPDQDNVSGPVEETGRDPSLTAGPDPDNRTGPEYGLAKGSMYSASRQC